MAGALQEACSFLENYWCRNQVFRTAQVVVELTATESLAVDVCMYTTCMYAGVSNWNILIDCLHLKLHTWELSYVYVCFC